MSSEFEAALREMLESVAIEAASEAIRQQRVIDEENASDGYGDRFLLRSHEAAEQLAISSTTLNRLTRSGELQCVRIGRTVRYSTEAIREWIREKESSDQAVSIPSSSTAKSKSPEIKKTNKIRQAEPEPSTMKNVEQPTAKRKQTKRKPVKKRTAKKRSPAPSVVLLSKLQLLFQPSWWQSFTRPPVIETSFFVSYQSAGFVLRNLRGSVALIGGP